jgi:hypothetical protein
MKLGIKSSKNKLFQKSGQMEAIWNEKEQNRTLKLKKTK